jgi:hypothetical protein
VIALALIGAAWAVDCGLCGADMEQDLNCNCIDAADEQPTDPDDPDCLWPNADYYFDYGSYGCAYDISAQDLDGDGLSYGTLTFPEGAAFPDLEVSLGCDNCPLDYNPEQLLRQLPLRRQPRAGGRGGGRGRGRLRQLSGRLQPQPVRSGL